MKTKEQKNWYDYTIGVCVILVLAIVPLFIGAKYVDVTPSESIVRSSAKILDVFSYYKSLTICFITLFMSIAFFMYVPEKGEKKYNLEHPIFFCGIAFILFVILSFFLTSYKELALIGISERYESMWTLISYMALMVISFKYCVTKFRVKLVICGLFAGIFIIGTIGMFQYFDMDIFSTEFGAKWVLGDMYQGNPLNIKFDEVYSLLYNPNCVGMYCSMLLPFTIILAVCLPFNIFKYCFEGIIKYISIILSVILIFNLVGSDSEGGFVAVFTSLFIAAVLGIVYIIKNKKYRQCSKVFLTVIFVIVSVFVLSSVIFILNNENVIEKISYNFDILTGKSEGSSGYYFKDLLVDSNKNRIEILTIDNSIFIDYNKDSKRLQISDKDNILLPYNECDFSIETIKEKRRNNHIIKSKNGQILSMDIFLKENIPVLELKNDNISIRFKVSDKGELLPVDKNYNIIDINKKADSIGFNGIEAFGTGRGYIWSRSMPLIFSNGIKGFISGSGPDSFAIAFPQFEIREKLKYLGNPYIIIDKPHNFYLQTAINTGLLSLVSFIVLFVTYIYRTIKSILKDIENDKLIISLKFAFLIGVIGYLISALATDSVVSVAPTFWIMLGTGFAISEFSKTK